ncbi:hypothetical protein D915_004249 [Fasciola hepatica]|uniref:Uncharacterized protein n=1 Tax=Fasciola hepatica TaxID=6192 RepID=A0A4E0RET5_FASHE|nr:hypothetical protein D915_004249 [Fasciola hepatica]
MREPRPHPIIQSVAPVNSGLTEYSVIGETGQRTLKRSIFEVTYLKCETTAGILVHVDCSFAKFWKYCGCDHRIHPTAMAKCGSGLQMTLSWVPASNGIVPPGAIDIGQNTFVARAKHAGEFIPGKLIPSAGQTYVSYAGVEHGVPQYEVLCVTGVNCGNCYKWSPAEGGHVPKNSVVAAIAGDGEPVYIARAELEGEKLVGKVHSGHDNAYFPHKGKEVPVENYEVLVWIKK